MNWRISGTQTADNHKFIEQKVPDLLAGLTDREISIESERVGIKCRAESIEERGQLGDVVGMASWQNLKVKIGKETRPGDFATGRTPTKAPQMSRSALGSPLGQGKTVPSHYFIRWNY